MFDFLQRAVISQKFIVREFPRNIFLKLSEEQKNSTNRLLKFNITSGI